MVDRRKEIDPNFFLTKKGGQNYFWPKKNVGKKNVVRKKFGSTILLAEKKCGHIFLYLKYCSQVSKLRQIGLKLTETWLF